MVGSWEMPGFRPRALVTEFPFHEILLTRESLGLDPLVLDQGSGLWHIVPLDEGPSDLVQSFWRTWKRVTST
ncbi:hypothetical protein Tco_1534347, partial [Tanacetum coccineum]